MQQPSATSSLPIGALELGNELARIRENAGLKQVELARRITFSPAVLSRIENGERVAASEEIHQILDEIGTDESIRLKNALTREWFVLRRPDLDHPDQELLWQAEAVARQLEELKASPEIKRAFEQRVSTYIGELQSAAGLLMKRDHQVAFIGSIGIGKSTAICRITNMEVPIPDAPHKTPVLEAGAGGITICEVHLRRGPGFGIIIEPRSDEEIRADVSDFADYISGSASGEYNEEDSQGISKEVGRAIRNMTKLRIRREKGEDGKTVRRDDARCLAEEISDRRELKVELLSRMELPRRDRRDIWHEANSGMPPLEWLKDTFEKINNGRHPDFSLPRRIEVIVPEPIISADDLSVKFIDTKGIDRTAARADLEVLLDDSHTLAVLCTGFNNAPATETIQLLERAKESGLRRLPERVAILVLPRPNEALAVKDDSGDKVEEITEGYELKSEQVAMRLQSLGVGELAVGFFDAFTDDPSTLRAFLVGGLRRSREAFRLRLKEIIENAKNLLLNNEKEEAHAVIDQASSLLKTWFAQHRMPESISAHIQDSLMSQISDAYASSLRASINREGEWHNLNFGYQLGFGARRLATLSIGRSVQGFSEICRNMAATPDFEDARELIQQTDRLVQSAYDELLQKVQLMGLASFRDHLKLDQAFWNDCRSEWGQGGGYKSRIASRNLDWFAQPERRALEQAVLKMIAREWSDALDRIEQMLSKDANENRCAS